MNNEIRETGEPDSELQTRVTDSEKAHIEGVLLDRIDGPFEPWPENWAEEMKERIRKRADLRRQNA